MNIKQVDKSKLAKKKKKSANWKIDQKKLRNSVFACFSLWHSTQFRLVLPYDHTNIFFLIFSL